MRSSRDTTESPALEAGHHVIEHVKALLHDAAESFHDPNEEVMHHEPTPTKIVDRVMTLHRGETGDVELDPTSPEIVHYLVDNEHTLATVEEIAFHLNEPATQVESDVYALEKLGLVRQVDVADLTLFGATMDSGRRQLMRGLCAWQERWHARLARIERAIGGKATQDENRGVYANG